MEKVIVHKMNSKGFDIAITTIVLIIIGVAFLIGAIFFVKNGFSFLKSGTEPILKTQGIESTKQACDLVCRSENSFAFCCNPIKMNEDEVYCSDSLINSKCNIDCSSIVCD